MSFPLFCVPLTLGLILVEENLVYQLTCRNTRENKTNDTERWQVLEVPAVAMCKLGNVLALLCQVPLLDAPRPVSLLVLCTYNLSHPRASCSRKHLKIANLNGNKKLTNFSEN